MDEAAERDVLSQGAFDFGTSGGQYVELSNPGTMVSSAGVPGAANVPGRVFIGSLDEASALLKIDAAVLRKTITDYDAFIIGATDKMPVPGKTAYRGTIGSCDKDATGNYKIDSYRIDKIMVRFMAPSTHHTMGGLVVDTDRHVIGKGGKALRKLEDQARQSLVDFLGRPADLEIWIKVRKNWRKDPRSLKEFGYLT